MNMIVDELTKSIYDAEVEQRNKTGKTYAREAIDSHYIRYEIMDGNVNEIAERYGIAEKYGISCDEAVAVFYEAWDKAHDMLHLSLRRGSTGLYGYADAAGNIVIPHKFHYAEDFSEGLAAVKDESGRYGYINEKGETVIPYQFFHAKHFFEGLAAVRYEDTRYGYINAEGQTIIPFEYDSAGPFTEGVAIVRRNITDKTVLFLDRYGNALHLGDYSFAHSCSNGTFAVEKNGRWGIIDKKGDIIIDFIYDSTNPFDKDGFALVTLDGKFFKITRDGKIHRRIFV